MTIFAKTTVEDIKRSFPTTEITKIEGRPTYSTLKPFLKGIRRCAEAITSLQAKGHLYLVVDAAEFTTITTKTAKIPTAPRLNPDVDAKDTQFQCQEKRYMHAREVEAYQLHNTVSDALKKVITENIDKVYLADIEVAERTVLEVITYLKTRYYRITTKEIRYNDKEMREPWDIECSIETYFKKVKDCVEFAADAVDADDITPKMQMQIMLPSMEQIQSFKHHVREWKRKTTKTPELFRAHFIEAYEELLEEERGANDEPEEPEDGPEKAYSAYSSEDIQHLLNSVGMGQEQEIQHQANMTTENARMLELLKKLTAKVSALEKSNRDNGEGGSNRKTTNVGNK